MHSTHIRLTDPLDSVPDLAGRRAIITGGSSGLGLVTARTLATRGARVIIGARDTDRALSARDRIIAEHDLPADRVAVAPLDLIDPDSVQRFARSVGDEPLDLLVLNAATSSGPLRHDHAGIESQFATNHLGHFALTAQLLPLLDRAATARVVTVSSTLYRAGRLDLTDLTDRDHYSPGRAYNRSKLANVLFAVELDRRLVAAGSAIRSLAAHPGMARTPLHSTYPSAATRIVTGVLARVIGREPEPADIGILTAALSPHAHPSLFWGPAGSRSHPHALGAPFTPAAMDPAAAASLWTASEQLTGARVLA